MTDKLTKEERILRELPTISRLMDTAIGIPGTKLRVGVDSIIGLLPVGGDVASLLVSLYLMNRARQLGASGKVLTKMLGNVLLDTAVGSVPIAGDAFDVIFKANQRNVDLLLKEYPALEQTVKQSASEDNHQEKL